MDDADPEALGRLFARMEDEGAEALRAEGLDPARMEVARKFEIRYVGQIYECAVVVPRQEITREHLAEVVDRFHALHESLYGYAERDNVCELVNVGVSVHGRLPSARFADDPADGAPAEAARTGTRRVFFADRGGFVEVPVYGGERLRAGRRIDGPAVVEEPGTTVVVFPGTHATLENRTYVLARSA